MENKIQVIKAIREITNLGLRESVLIANKFDSNESTLEEKELVLKAQKLAVENMANFEKQKEEHNRRRSYSINDAIRTIMSDFETHEDLIKEALKKLLDDWSDDELKDFLVGDDNDSEDE